MHKVVIADTSCLIVLQKIELLFILKELYSGVVTTSSIASEYGESLPPWIEIINPSGKFKTELPLTTLGAGEASAIALALENPQYIPILDDLLARRIAMDLSLSVTGTLGILAKAKRKGLIAAIKPVLLKLKEIKFRMSEEVEESILKECNE